VGKTKGPLLELFEGQSSDQKTGKHKKNVNAFKAAGHPVLKCVEDQDSQYGH